MTGHGQSIGIVAAAIAIVRRDDRVLLVRRGGEPNIGLWAFPGGAQEIGETIVETALRELAEETGVRVTNPVIATAFDVVIVDPDDADRIRAQYLVVAVECDWVAGEAVAADDAAEAGWFTCDAIAGLTTVPRVAELARAALGVRQA